MSRYSRSSPPSPHPDEADNLSKAHKCSVLAVAINLLSEENTELAIEFAEKAYKKIGVKLSEDVFDPDAPVDSVRISDYNIDIREQTIDLIGGLDDSTFNIVAEFARAVNSVSPFERTVMLEAALEIRNRSQMSEVSLPPVNAPKFDFKPGTLKLNADFQKVASQNQWAERDRSVWGRDLSKIVDFLKSTYQPWLGRGMTQADLKSVDKRAYQALHNYLKSIPGSIPDGLDLPTLKDANLERLIYPEDRDQLLSTRAYHRDRKSLAMN